MQQEKIPLERARAIAQQWIFQYPGAGPQTEEEIAFANRVWFSLLEKRAADFAETIPLDAVRAEMQTLDAFRDKTEQTALVRNLLADFVVKAPVDPLLMKYLGITSLDVQVLSDRVLAHCGTIPA
jgi:hypothetical protein